MSANPSSSRPATSPAGDAVRGPQGHFLDLSPAAG